MKERKDNYVEVELVYKEDNAYKIEKVYAEKVGEYYQLKGVPAFASGVAYEDVISVEIENGHLFFDELIQPSGHSVVHIVILKPEKSTLFLSALAVFGVYINYLHNNLYLVIDVPPSVFYKDFRDFLIKQSELGDIDVSEACVSDLHFSTLAEKR